MMNDNPRINSLGQLVIPPSMMTHRLNDSLSQDTESLELIKVRDRLRQKEIRTINKFNYMLNLLEDALVS